MKPSDIRRYAISLMSIVTIIMLAGFAFYSYGKNKWVIDNIISIISILILWKYYRSLHFNVTLYAMMIFMFMLHNLGTFGFYSNWYLGIEWDFYVHFYFGLFFSIALSNLLIRTRYFHHHLSLKMILLITVFITMGLGAIHELIEFAGASILGEGEGVLFFGTGDTGFADTEWDLINNFLGSILGSLIMFIKKDHSR